ncbi:methionine--tRNA ligase [Patescibacteria group bacterium]
MSKFYVTTSIPYANANPHIGFAMEAIEADCLARYHRLIGDDVYFLTGTDEHGMKIHDTAEELGISPQEHVDNIVKKNKELKELLNLTYDDFIRTTSDRHKKGAQKLWMKLVEAGDIYKDKYEGFYCKGCEAYVTEKDLEDGKCPTHKKTVEKFSEENYYFKLSKYSEKIVELVESDELRVEPEFRKREFLNVAKEGLTDVSFSRPKEKLSWGVEVPNDPEHTMYVWCDALSNYITALDYENEGELFKKYWPCDAHVIGKDIVRFHVGIWIGILLSAGLPVPKMVPIHGFIGSGGQKMSKSLGNVISPEDVVEKYGTDPLRYYLLKEIPTTEDGDFTYERFEEVYNSELANNLGNLMNRVTKMTERYFKGKVPENTAPDKEIQAGIEEMWETYHKMIDKFDLKKAVEAVMVQVDAANKYIEDKKPWVLAKEDEKELANVLYNLLEVLRHVGYALYPYIPEAAEKLLKTFGKDPLGSDFTDVSKWGGLEVGEKIGECEPLFPRLEEN